MREIKFRAWNITQNKMEIPFSIYDIKDDYWDNNTKNKIFLQFTGLLDKNGKEIYEGDFIKCGWYVATTDVHKTQIIMLDDVRDIFLKLPIEGFRNYAGVEYEIIGNIYENHELLSK